MDIVLVIFFDKTWDYSLISYTILILDVFRGVK